MSNEGRRHRAGVFVGAVILFALLGVASVTILAPDCAPGLSESGRTFVDNRITWLPPGTMCTRYDTTGQSSDSTRFTLNPLVPLAFAMAGMASILAIARVRQ